MRLIKLHIKQWLRIILRYFNLTQVNDKLFMQL